jgi:hypothetical protein
MKTFAQFLLEVGRLELRGLDWNTPVNWATIAQHIHDNTCMTARRTKDCGHPLCQEGQELANIADGAFEDYPPSQHDIERMIKFINKKKCADARIGRKCRHPACGKHEHYVDWLQGKI